MRRLSRGFTLVELMAVVAIVAVLATIAVFSYKRYMRRARTVEGAAFLMDIKMKQEAHFMTYSSYVSTGTNENDFYPKSSVFKAEALPVTWGWDCTATPIPQEIAGWCELGITPTSDVTYFQYVTMGWSPASTYTPPVEFIRHPTKRWWFARAFTYPTNSTSLTLELRLSSELVEIVEIEGP